MKVSMPGHLCNMSGLTQTGHNPFVAGTTGGAGTTFAAVGGTIVVMGSPGTFIVAVSGSAGGRCCARKSGLLSGSDRS